MYGFLIFALERVGVHRRLQSAQQLVTRIRGKMAAADL